MATLLPAEIRTLYAELLERLLAESARRTIGKAKGTFTRKKLGGQTYVYFQYYEPGGTRKQLYLGIDGPVIKRLEQRFSQSRQEEASARHDIERLSSLVLAGGGWSLGAGPARVLKAFGNAGVLDAGLVLIGTHAFGLIGNHLGIRWTAAQLRTEDVDLAGVALAAASGAGPVDTLGTLERLELGFLPLPQLDSRLPSTSFKVRGSALRVDFLTPGKEGPPVQLPGLGTFAQRLPGLEYLLENPGRAAALDGGGFLVLVPDPARFAVHKLTLAGERPASQETKAEKDLAQSAELIEFLAEARPGDLRIAWDAAKEKGWTRRIGFGLKRLSQSRPAAAKLISAMELG